MNEEEEEEEERDLIECTATQFECLCGKKRCVEASRVRDGKADCDDASDEEPTSSLSKFLLEEVASADTAHRVCPNGERARHGRYSNLNSSLVLCDRPRDCHESLGEVCIVSSFSLPEEDEEYR